MAQRIEVPGMGIVEFPDGMNDAQITAAIRQNSSGGSPSANMQADPVADAVRAVPAGAARGAIGLAGIPGDTAQLVGEIGAGRKSIAGGFMWPPVQIRDVPQAQAPAPVATETVRPKGPPGNLASGLGRGAQVGQQAASTDAAPQNWLPTSGDLRGMVEGAVGPLYQPQTGLGRAANTFGEFLPGAIFPARSIGQRLIGNVAAPAAGAETGRQLTEGTSAEPYAMAAGGVLGGGLAAALSRGSPQRAAIPAAEDRIAHVRNAAEAGYQSPEVGTVIFRPGVADALANTTLRQLDRARFNDRIAPQTRGILEDLRAPTNGVWHSIEDLQAARTQLGHIAGNFSNPIEQAAASRAIQNITNYIERMPQRHLAAGDAAAAGRAWTQARQNYAVAKTAEKVQNKLLQAENQAQSANTGANAGNATRQRLRTLLNNPKQARGITDAESDLIAGTVRGSRTGNTLRTLGDAMGAGGGARATVAALGGGVGGLAAGLGPVGFALPFVGSALRGASNRITRRQADRIVDQILSRAPAMQEVQRQGAQRLSEQQRRALATQLLMSTSASRQPAYQ